MSWSTKCSLTGGLKNNTINYIRKLFLPWNLVKVGEASPIGTFKTSTIDASHKVINENDEGIFPGLKVLPTVKNK
jgi:hypothetical protein